MRHRPRLGNLDVLRALAALSVLAIHAYGLGGRNAPIKAEYWYDVPLINLATGVWLFFAISGYVITRPFVDRLVAGAPPPATVPYALRRAARIFPLYWLALAALIAIDGGLVGTRPWQLGAHLLLVNNLVPGRQEALFPAAWTLTLEVLFYIAVPLLATAVRQLGRPLSPERLARLVILSWAASIIFTALADLQGDGQIGLWLRGSLPAMWQMFCPGILLAVAPHLRGGQLAHWLVELPARRGAMVVAAVLLLAGALLGAAAPLRFGIVAYQLLVDASHPLFAVGYGLLVAAAIRARPWAERASWLRDLGLASYGIYLLHPVLAALLLREGLAPLPHDTVPAFLLHLVVLSALTVPLALLSWRWLERPALGLAGRLGQRLGPSADRDRGSSTIRSVTPPQLSAQAGAEIRRFWNERAREDAFYFVDTRQTYRDPDPERFWESADLVDYVLDGLGVQLRPTDTVLEIGCGIGRITRGLAKRAGEVIALDVSDEMLSQAQALNPHLQHVRWVLGDGTSLQGVPDGSVDACVSVVVLQHVPDPAITLGYVREVGRVLAPGGWAALQVSNDPDLHRPRDGIVLRTLALAGRAPKGQRHPAWLGSHVELPELKLAAAEGAMDVERVWGEGSQYCQVLLRRGGS